MAIDHERTVLAAIIPSRRDLLLFSLQHLEVEHFHTERFSNVFKLLDRYYSISADIVTRDTLTDLLYRLNFEPTQAILYEQLYDELVNTEVADHEFRYSVDALKDLRSKQLTGEAIAASMEILERGVEIEKVVKKGHLDAREFLYGELGRIDRLGHAELAPEGNMMLEGPEVRREYEAKKSGSLKEGILSGIPSLDRVTSGFHPGELILLTGYTGEGKSMLATQVAWHAAVEQGRNVFFATSETVRSQARRRVISRHSLQPQFGLFPDGVNAAELKNASLDAAKELVFDDVLEDLAKNPAYGVLYIAQIPRGGTLGFLEARLKRQQALWNIDLVVIDYLALLKPDRARQNQREELNDILKDTKVLATSFDSGRGVPIISPWAMSQDKYREALTKGTYTLANLADTSEAEKSSDEIISLLRLPDRANEVTAQFLKNRDGELPQPFQMTTDFRFAYFEERVTAAMSGDAWLADLTG